MPDIQLTFDGDRVMPAVTSYRCVGGCGRTYPVGEIYESPAGPICPRCFNDLYTRCADCDRPLRYDDWGECVDLRTAPDGTHRCPECHERLFSRCSHCGRLTPRDSGDVRIAPDDGLEMCANCWQAYWYTCTACGTVASVDDSQRSPDGMSLCAECFEAEYVACAACGRGVDREEYFGWEGDPYCGDCYGRADTWKVQPWSGEAGSFDKVGSERRFGVELETCDCEGWRDLHGQTEWGCVYECSTPGREFISPILQGDDGFADIRAMCDIADNRGWSVDSSCGLHIHLDLSNESPEECLRIAYAYRKTYPLWKVFVNEERRTTSMCGSPQYTCADIRTYEHIEDFAEVRDRFEFVNWRAYIRHGSFEVRLYPGTLNAREICNWIALHARFMDAVKGMSYSEIDRKIGAQVRTNWRGLCSVIDDTDLLDYWRRKARTHGTDLPALWEHGTDLPALWEPREEPREEPSDPVEWYVSQPELRSELMDDLRRRIGTLAGYGERECPTVGALPESLRMLTRDENDFVCPCPPCRDNRATDGWWQVTFTGGVIYHVVEERAFNDGRVNSADYAGRRAYYDHRTRRFLIEIR